MFSRPSSLGWLWLWASIGVAALFGTFASAGAFVWPLAAAGIGLLACKTRNRAILAVVACVAGLAARC